MKDGMASEDGMTLTLPRPSKALNQGWAGAMGINARHMIVKTTPSAGTDFLVSLSSSFNSKTAP